MPNVKSLIYKIISKKLRKKFLFKYDVLSFSWYIFTRGFKTKYELNRMRC